MDRPLTSFYILWSRQSTVTRSNFPVSSRCTPPRSHSHRVRTIRPCRLPLAVEMAGVARPAERGAARRSRRDGHLSVRALRAIESATGNNLVGLIFARDRLNLKEFTAELLDSRRTSTDNIWQRDGWRHGSLATALARARKWAGRWPEGCRVVHCSMHRWGRSQCVRTGSRDREALSRDAAHCPSLAHRQGQARGRMLRRARACPGRKRPDYARDGSNAHVPFGLV